MHCLLNLNSKGASLEENVDGSCVSPFQSTSSCQCHHVFQAIRSSASGHHFNAVPAQCIIESNLVSWTLKFFSHWLQNKGVEIASKILSGANYAHEHICALALFEDFWKSRTDFIGFLFLVTLVVVVGL